MSTRQTTLRQLVVAVDPNWAQDSRVVVEYSFSRRNFIADYGNRGAYHDPLAGQEDDDFATRNL